MANELKTVAEMKTFVTAGRAIFTVENEKTGNRFTYRVKRPKPDPRYAGSGIMFVNVLSGPDNTTHYSKLGMLNGNFFGFVRGVDPKAPAFVAFAWLWNHLKEGRELPETVKVRHAGRCCRCAKVLTVPESIDSGIGPECRAKMGLPMSPKPNKTLITEPLPPPSGGPRMTILYLTADEYGDERLYSVQSKPNVSALDPWPLLMVNETAGTRVGDFADVKNAEEYLKFYRDVKIIEKMVLE